MNKSVKKIIAREGLIIIVVLGIGVLCFVMGIIITKNCVISNDPDIIRLVYNFGESLQSLGIFIAVFGYPVSWFTRFIIWAVKTLKEK